MKSSLQTLQRIQKFNIDEQRKILAELQTNEEKLQSIMKYAKGQKLKWLME